MAINALVQDSLEFQDQLPGSDVLFGDQAKPFVAALQHLSYANNANNAMNEITQY